MPQSLLCSCLFSRTTMKVCWVQMLWHHPLWSMHALHCMYKHMFVLLILYSCPVIASLFKWCVFGDANRHFKWMEMTCLGECMGKQPFGVGLLRKVWNSKTQANLFSMSLWGILAKADDGIQLEVLTWRTLLYSYVFLDHFQMFYCMFDHVWKRNALFSKLAGSFTCAQGLHWCKAAIICTGI